MLFFVQLALNAQSNNTLFWTKWSATDTLYYNDGDLKMIKFTRLNKRKPLNLHRKHQFLYHFFDSCGNLREKDIFTIEMSCWECTLLKYQNKKVRQSDECDPLYMKEITNTHRLFLLGNKIALNPNQK